MKIDAQISNSQVKKFALLKQKKHRDAKQLIIVEGIKICEELLKSRYKCLYLIIDYELYKAGTFDCLINLIEKQNITILYANESQIRNIATTRTPQGVVAIAEIPRNEIDFSTDAFIGLENIQDPGNLGTNIRSAFWFGIENIIVSRNSVDIYNTKTIRSTMGNLFHINIVYVDNIIEYCENNFPNHQIYAASLDATVELSEIKPPSKFGLIFGNESSGLTPEILNEIPNKYIIKGSGKAESLNLAVSAGISLYHFTIGKFNKQELKFL